MLRAYHFNLVAKHSLVLKLQILKFEVAVFYSFNVVKKRIFGKVQLSRSAISKPVKVFLPNWNGKPLTSMKLNDQKLIGITDLLLSFPVISKRTFYYTHFNKPYYGRDPFGHFRRIELPEALLSLILISEKIYLIFIK